MAVMRGVEAVNQVMQRDRHASMIVTHSNLMTLILKYFDNQIGYLEWENLQNSDVYCIQFDGEKPSIKHVVIASS